MMKINILGTEYEIKEMSVTEYPKLAIANGLAELYSKELIIDKNMNGETGEEFANFDEFKKKVIRHEIVHAFFHESGLTDYCSDEKLVNWIALQIPKIVKIMQETHSL